MSEQWKLTGPELPYILEDNQPGDTFPIVAAVDVPSKGGCHYGAIQVRGDDAQANAERIVRCVNAFDDLLETCKAFQDKTLLMDLWSNDDLKPILRRMKAAIAKAEGETT